MTVAKNPNAPDLIDILVFILPLAVIAATIWWFSLAFLLAVPAWFFIKDKIISKGLYILTILLIALYALYYPPTKQFFDNILQVHANFFSLSAFGGGFFGKISYFFGTNSFKNIMSYGVFGAVLGAIVTFSFGRFFYWFATRKNASKRLLKTRKDVKPNFQKYRKDFNVLSERGVPLGVIINLDGKSPLVVPHGILDKHVCLVGTTGSGKTTTLYHFICNALINRKPVVYIDGKGDLSNIRRFRDFAPDAEIITMDGQTGYNPFSSGTPTELTDKIISMFDWSEEHYKLGAARFIQLLLRYMELCKIDKNIVNIIKYCDLTTVKNHYVSQSTGTIDAGGPEPDTNAGTFSLANIGKNTPGVSQTPQKSILSTETEGKYWMRCQISI